MDSKGIIDLNEVLSPKDLKIIKQKASSTGASFQEAATSFLRAGLGGQPGKR